MATYVHNPNDLTTEMTANDVPSPNVVSASTNYHTMLPWEAFSHVVDPYGNCWATSGVPTGWLKFDFGSGNSGIAGTYTVTCGDGNNLTRAPKTWTLQGSNNDTDWDVLDTQTNVPAWTALGEMRIYSISSPAAYRYYKLDITGNHGNAYLIVGEVELIREPQSFYFSNPIPTHLSTVYGITEQLQLTTTISGEEESYTYDASFYDEFGVQVGTTVLGINSGSPVSSNASLSTSSGIDYNWYVVVTSSGCEGTSSTYTFSNRFLYEGYVTENNDPVSRTVRLYYRDTGELIDFTTSSGSNGYYSLDALVNDEHFIIAFDDEAGEDYNALILDRLLSNGEE